MYAVMKGTKYFSANGTWTTNINMAYVYEDQGTAERVARAVGGVEVEVISLRKGE